MMYGVPFDPPESISKLASDAFISKIIVIVIVITETL